MISLGQNLDVTLGVISGWLLMEGIKRVLGVFTPIIICVQAAEVVCGFLQNRLAVDPVSDVSPRHSHIKDMLLCLLRFLSGRRRVTLGSNQ